MANVPARSIARASFSAMMVSASRRISVSALHTTSWLVAPRWMIPRACGAASPKVCTCAITSWRRRASCASALAKSMSSKCARSSVICAAVTESPSSCCDSASANQIRRHVPNLRRALQVLRMRALALRVSSGERYPECSSTACVASFVTMQIVVPDAPRGQWRSVNSCFLSGVRSPSGFVQDYCGVSTRPTPQRPR